MVDNFKILDKVINHNGQIGVIFSNRTLGDNTYSIISTSGSLMITTEKFITLFTGDIIINEGILTSVEVWSKSKTDSCPEIYCVIMALHVTNKFDLDILYNLNYITKKVMYAEEMKNKIIEFIKNK